MPSNRIVVDYGDTDDLFLIGRVNIETGAYRGPEFPSGWKGPTVESFDYPTLRLALLAPERVNAEGFVVWFNRHTAVKVKYETYIALHRIVSSLNLKEVWRQLAAGTYDQFVEALPDEFHEWAREAHDKLTFDHGEIKAMAEAFFENVKPLAGNRREFAMAAKTYPGSNLLFLLLDGKDIDPVIWRAIEPKGANGEL